MTDPEDSLHSENCICIPTEQALALIKDRPEGEKLLSSPYYLIVSLITEEYDFANAFTKIGFPGATRTEIVNEFARWQKEGKLKPDIPSSIFKMLINCGIPLEPTDFDKIYEKGNNPCLDSDS